VVNVRNEDAVEAVQRITGGQGVHYVLECSGAPNALNEAAKMVNRGGRFRYSRGRPQRHPPRHGPDDPTPI
jgi:threonine dehydrogenase-like Zn-dependent dehydrogenase